jgi:small membrane protein
MIIKFLLISAVVIFGAFLLRERVPGQRLALRRLVGAAIVALGVIAIAVPDTTVWAAHLVGVKRGTDLVLYIFVMTFLFTIVAAYQRINHLEQRLVALTRQVALMTHESHSARGQGHE